MRNNIIFISLLAIVFLTSCATVVSKYPIGLEKYAITSEAWKGTWLSHDGVIKIKVIDETNGIIQLAWIEDKDKEFKLETITIQLLTGKKWHYANVLEMDNQTAKEEYFWGKIKKDESQIIFWFPSTEAFSKAAESKKISAIISKSGKSTNGKEITQDVGSGKVLLLDEPGKIIDLIEKEESQFFYWEDPLVLIKLHE